MKIGFIFECGPKGPDVKVCRHLVEQLDASIEFDYVALDNKQNLISECGVAAGTLLDSGCQKVIIVWDLFPPWRDMKPCRHEDREGIFRSLQAEGVDLNQVELVCISEELEAWLLADKRAVTAMIARRKHPHPVGRIPAPRRPDNVRSPKKRLMQIFNQELGYRYVDYQHALLIAQELPDFNRIRRSVSFYRFALKVAGIQL